MTDTHVFTIHFRPQCVIRGRHLSRGYLIHKENNSGYQFPPYTPPSQGRVSAADAGLSASWTFPIPPQTAAARWGHGALPAFPYQRKGRVMDTSADDALIRAMIEAGRDEPVSAVDMGWTFLACALWGLVLWVLFFKALLSLL